ncbi:hypothetical protein MMC07_007303 [Pseudocyphellaria aurata]|nr:hypothetical protein [Pseudocyphellaria aurata]
MVKSILKTVPRPNTPTISHEDRNRETALYHANLLQERKDVQCLILESTETLLDFPPSSASDPAQPSELDVIEVKKLLKPFQPSDYDALVKERNIDKKCGYVLCPRPNRLQDTDAKYRIFHAKKSGTHSLKFIEREDLERWCSDECGKRALYIRVQLSDEPAWSRALGNGEDFMLLDEGNRNQQHLNLDGELAQNLRNLDIGDGEERVVAALKDLALERGDRFASEGRSRLLEVDIHENEGRGNTPLNPSHQVSNGLWSSIEGYNPRLKGVKANRYGLESDADEKEDMMPTI